MSQKDDLISRQAAIDAFDLPIFNIKGKENAERVVEYIKAVLQRIKELPSAEPERKKGRWKLIEDTDMRKKGFLDGLYASVAWMNYECSCCGHIVHNSLRGREENRTSFCPNCGADMRGGEDALN